jgi:hypothetical protein
MCRLLAPATLTYHRTAGVTRLLYDHRQPLINAAVTGNNSRAASCTDDEPR